MRIWIALIVAPLFALADQTIALALVGPGCAAQTTALLHASHALFLALAIAATIAAWRSWLATAAGPADGGDGTVKIVTLKNSKAADAARVTEQLFGGLTIAVDESSNSIILKGSTKTIDEVLAVLSKLDELDRSGDAGGNRGRKKE